MPKIFVFGLLHIEEGANAWFDYPGFEFWKFVNLLVFVVAGLYILRRPLADALRSRREGIKRDLLKAQEERDRALAQLAEVESRLARLDAEVAAIQERSQKEADAETQRINRATEAEMAQLRDQARREIENAGKAAKHELRKFAAAQSVRLAEDMIQREIRPDDDVRLIGRDLEEMGRIKP